MAEETLEKAKVRCFRVLIKDSPSSESSIIRLPHSPPAEGNYPTGNWKSISCTQQRTLWSRFNSVLHKLRGAGSPGTRQDSFPKDNSNFSLFFLKIFSYDVFWSRFSLPKLLLDPPHSTHILSSSFSLFRKQTCKLKMKTQETHIHTHPLTKSIKTQYYES